MSKKSFAKQSLFFPSSLEKHREAVENFKKALELEPDNDSYKSNLQIAEDKVKSGVAPSGGMGGMFPGMGGGISNILTQR